MLLNQSIDVGSAVKQGLNTDQDERSTALYCISDHQSLQQNTTIPRGMNDDNGAWPETWKNG
jgi:hypothetical protein